MKQELFMKLVLHTDIHWLPKDNLLSRFYELKNENATDKPKSNLPY